MAPNLTPLEANVSWAREVLTRYGEREDVRRNLHANFGTEVWWGPASAHYEGKRRSLETLKDGETNPHIRRWLDEEIQSLQHRVEREKIFEEREF